MTATRTFSYETIDTDGNRAKGKLDAVDQDAVASALRRQGVVPLKISKAGSGMQTEIKIPGRSDRVKLKDLAVFSRQFSAMTGSGLTLLRCLAILEDQTVNPALRKALGAVRGEVESGRSLSDAMAVHDRIFPALTIAMIRAGEAGGFLDDALERVAENLEKDVVLRSKIKGAMTYPVIVIAFSALMIAGVLIFIVPVFEKMFSQLGGKLPLPTQIIVDISHSLLWLVPLIAVVSITTVSVTRRRLRTRPGFRLFFDRFKLRMPVFGKLLTKIAISRFSRNLGTLLAVGVPILQALDIVGATTGNAVITEAMTDVAESVRNGQNMSRPLSKHDVFPPMVKQMIEVGEESGQISAMLDKIADFYDREVDSAAEALTAAIEPVMVVVMGALVGGMVVCLYLPMFSIYSHIQGGSS